MTSGQCDPNSSPGFFLTVCMGIIAVAGMPEARINLQNFCSFFFIMGGCHLHHFCQLQYYNSFLLSLSPGMALNF
jgi:hypothetical protein